jgi:hypothetical protein
MRDMTKNTNNLALGPREATITIATNMSLGNMIVVKAVSTGDKSSEILTSLRSSTSMTQATILTSLGRIEE